MTAWPGGAADVGSGGNKRVRGARGPAYATDAAAARATARAACSGAGSCCTRRRPDVTAENDHRPRTAAPAYVWCPRVSAPSPLSGRSARVCLTQSQVVRGRVGVRALALAELPPGWVVKEDVDGKIYFERHARTANCVRASRATLTVGGSGAWRRPWGVSCGRQRCLRAQPVDGPARGRVAVGRLWCVGGHTHRGPAACACAAY